MKKHLTFKMIIALLAGVLFGTFCLVLKQTGYLKLYETLDYLLFRDISNSNGIGLFYIISTLFINGLKLVIVPMIFTSIIIAINHISDSAKLKQISKHTLLGFIQTAVIALAFASLIGYGLYKVGIFKQLNLVGETATTTAGTNPLMIVVNALPDNLLAGFSNNGNVLAVMVIAIMMGLLINKLNYQNSILYQLIIEINTLTQKFLTYIINYCAPIAIFALLARTFAIYGIDNLTNIITYVIVTTIALLIFLFIFYPLYYAWITKSSPLIFIKQISPVAIFGFSTSSSAATLPLNLTTTVDKLGANQDVAAFVLPLGMTINMNGTAIMQVIATIFITISAGYDLEFTNLIFISIIALIASIGTPAAPGSGAIVLYTVLSSLGYTNEFAIIAYTMVLGINRPIEMLVTALNVVGDSIIATKVTKAIDKEAKQYAVNVHKPIKDML